MDYDIDVIYENEEDRKLVEAGSEGNTEEQMLKDIKFFMEQKDYNCSRCKKHHKLKIRLITINFTS